MKKLIYLTLILTPLSLLLTGCQHQASDSGNITLDFKQDEVETESNDVKQDRLIGQTEDYWVYIRTYNRYSYTDEDTAGRSKQGDIIDIRSVNDHPILSEKEKKEWAIIRIKGLTKKDIQEYKQDWQEQTSINKETNEIIYQTKAYRKYKVDIKGLNLKLGVNLEVKDFSIIKDYIELKTESDIQAYRWGTRWYALTKPLRRLARKIIQPTKAAENVSTVNKTGEDYDTLTLWEDAVDGDLVSETRQETAECYDDDGTLSDAPKINGSITNSSYFMKITVPEGERHEGTAGTGFAIASNASGYAMNMKDDYSVWEWTELNNFYGNYTTFFVINDSDYCRFNNNIIHNTNNYDHSALFSVDGDNQKFYNNIIYSSDSDDSDNRVGKFDGYVYNNSAYGYFDIGGIYSDNKQAVVINNYVDVTGDDYGQTFGWGGGTDTNASGDATAPGTTVFTNLTAADEWENVSAGTEDFHLQSTSSIIGDGTDLSGTFTIDIDNETRSDWDIGADEYVSLARNLRIKGGVKIKGSVRVNKTD